MSSQRLVGLLYLVNREIEKISILLIIVVFTSNPSPREPDTAWA